MKVSDYVCSFLEEQGVSTVFTLTGGGIMYLVESLGNSNLEYICCHHEQACSIAAQAYSMSKNDLGVCLVTTGPGGTNALTGAAAAYVDSTPTVFLTGQVKRSDFASIRGVRQFGAQENDIISMAKPVTKYAEVVMEPEDIRYHMEKAVYLAREGRKGPVWIDIPLDVQSAEIDLTVCKSFDPMEEGYEISKSEEIETESQKALFSSVFSQLQSAKRPLILAGHGVMASHSEEDLRRFQESTGFPVLCTWRGLGLYGAEDPFFFGSPGLQAPRYSNMILQGCDLLIVLGSRLDNMITAFNENHFAFRGKKIIVDVDEAEVKKLDMPEVTPIIQNVKEFLEKINSSYEEMNFIKPNIDSWLESCRKLKAAFPLLAEQQEDLPGIDLYKGVAAVSNNATAEDTIVVSSTSRCNTAGHIAFSHKKGQKSISSMGMGSMGFALPSTIGAYYANKKNRVLLFEGDGSLQLNIQEFQTIRHNNMDVKMFIFSNKGYAAIATMQERNFDGHYVGSNEESGVTMPDLEKIANAYGIPYILADNPDTLEEKVKEAMETKGPVICDFKGSIKFDEIPKCISSINEEGKRVSANLENPYPFLPIEKLEEIYNEMLQ